MKNDTSIRLNNDCQELMRVNDVAEMLGCSVGHLYNLTSKKLIPHCKKGKSLYFFKGDIIEWIMEGNCEEVC